MMIQGLSDDLLNNISNRGFDFSIMLIGKMCHDPLPIRKRSFFFSSICNFLEYWYLTYNIIIVSELSKTSNQICFFGGYFHIVVIVTGCGNNF